MHPVKLLLLFICMLFLSASTLAQINEARVTQAVKVAVVDSLSAVLLNKYIFPDTAIKMSNYLKKRLEDGAYKTLSNPGYFARVLSLDVNSIYNDIHMRIYYDAPFEKALRQNSYANSVTRQMQFEQVARQKNFGFLKVEILNRNIGYVYISQFYDVNEQSIETVKSAFSFLKNINELIVDVRDDGGGEPDMVKFICSYFFKEKTHLNSFYDRHVATDQYWTEPFPASLLFSSMPLYVLVNKHTYSAAEEFAYDLQSQHRATIVGEKTGGGAHWVSSNSISNGFIGNMPFKKAVNPVTGKNWEKVGVKPNISCNGVSALDIALQNAYGYQINTANDTDAVKSAKWFRSGIDARLSKFKMSTAALKTFTGNYKGHLITFEKGNLYFTDTNGYKIGLIPITDTCFVFTTNDHHLEFHKDKAGNINEMDFIYQDGHLEKFTKSDN